MTTRTITVPEIFCQTCQKSIEGALSVLDGVARAVVDIERRQVTVDYDEAAVSLAALIAAIEEQGYDIPETSLPRV